MNYSCFVSSRKRLTRGFGAAIPSHCEHTDVQPVRVDCTCCFALLLNNPAIEVPNILFKAVNTPARPQTREVGRHLEY